MTFEFKHFSELSIEELYEILQLRAEIFVVEQDCVYNDVDGLDTDAIHQFSKKDNCIIAYSRLLKPGTRFANYSIGRVVVKKEFRAEKIGDEMMKEAKKYLIEKMGAKKIKISAQKYLQRFYENLGFEVTTEDYLEDGIPHVGMMYQIF